MSDPFQIAAKQLGMNERDQNAALSEFMANGGVNLDPAVTAWCAAYVNASLAQAGMKGTGSNMARSFLDWGQEVDQPQKGDLAVFSRGDPNGPYGHVGFFDGYNEDGTLRILGGNQGDGVSYASYSPDKLLGFRRGEGMGAPGAMPSGSAPAAPGNALAGMTAPQAPQQNALAVPEPSQMVDMRQDPRAFFNVNRGRNALSLRG